MSQPAAPPAAAAAPAESAATHPPKSFLVTWLLALLLGTFGADRFYLGKIGTGVAKLVTLRGLSLLTGRTTDASGRRLAGHDELKVLAWIVSAIVLALGIGGIAGAAFAAASLTSMVDPVPATPGPAAPRARPAVGSRVSIGSTVGLSRVA